MGMNQLDESLSSLLKSIVSTDSTTLPTKYFTWVVQKCKQKITFQCSDGIENLLSEIIVLDFKCFV